MSTDCTPKTPTSSRRTRTMKKRYSMTDGSQKHNNNRSEDAGKSDKYDRRRSFAVEMDQIPSFNSVFEAEKQQEQEPSSSHPQRQQQRTQRRERRHRRSNSTEERERPHHHHHHHSTEIRSRRSSSMEKPRRSSSTEKPRRRRTTAVTTRGGGGGSERRRSSRGIQVVQETKVIVERVKSSDKHVFFQDKSQSSHTETTASTSTHSSLLDQEDDPFATMGHMSNPELSFDDDDSFFNMASRYLNSKDEVEKKIENENERSNIDIDFQPDLDRSSKYANLGSRMRGAQLTTEEDLFAGNNNNNKTTKRERSSTSFHPIIIPNFEEKETHATKSKRASSHHQRLVNAGAGAVVGTSNHKKGNRPSSAHTRLTAAILSPRQRPKSPVRPRRRRTSLGETTNTTTNTNTKTSGIPLPSLASRGITVPMIPNLVTSKSSEYKALGGGGGSEGKGQQQHQHQSLEWSLAKLVGHGSNHAGNSKQHHPRRSLLSKRHHNHHQQQQQQDQLCQDFFGENINTTTTTTTTPEFVCE